MQYKKEEVVWGLLRLSMGFIFLWAFFDKLFGLGFSTVKDKSWILGNSPTFGFLKSGTHGIFSSIFQSLAGNHLVDWLFMLGLLFIGVALIFGVLIKMASYAGFVMMLLMWSALLPPANNPILDDHIIYAIILYGISVTNSSKFLSFSKRWENTNMVKKYPILR